jgi:signal transduction histidine kinase
LTREREQEAKIYLTERLASVGEMASGIAHELNNPLTSVIGLSALLAEEELPGSVGDDIKAICQEARRASQIVKNLLSFARRHDPKRQLTQIGDIVNDVLKLRTYEQEANNIAVITSFGTELPLVMVDNFQIQQAFLNIILNAEQAMHEAHGKGCLKITTELRGGAVRISFTDDGPGIKPANRKRIFDPFFTTKEVGKGTGLGLSITYGIIKSHNGRIWADSEPGQGSTFIVELPVYNNK